MSAEENTQHRPLCDGRASLEQLRAQSERNVACTAKAPLGWRPSRAVYTPRPSGLRSLELSDLSTQEGGAHKSLRGGPTLGAEDQKNKKTVKAGLRWLGSPGSRVTP